VRRRDRGAGACIAGATGVNVLPILEQAIAARTFPGGIVEVGRSGGVLATFAAGRQTYDPNAALVDAHTIYDLASLTKVLATTPLIAAEVSSGRMRLGDRVRHWIPCWTGEERQRVTLRDLLEHASGLPAHRHYYKSRQGRASFELAICEEPLEYAPRSQSIYSDPGFMLAGFALERAASASLADQFAAWKDRERLANTELLFRPPQDVWARIAPTEDSEYGEEQRGIVHDENARALDGVAAHAGLFGTAAAVGAVARWWMRSPSLAAFSKKTDVPGSSRALGWDTMLPTSSCGTRMSATAIGHTGFTGTSLWIDAANDLYVVILTNRVHPSREGDGIQGVRRALHDAIVTDLAGA
jgi:CubicO group peptidase (beta-lactamase class C family)